MEAEESDYDLRGQVAIVTGGGRGLGRELALGLARAGVAVGVLARTTAEVEETAELVVREDGRAIALTADVTDLAAMEAAVAAIQRELGPIDLLISNAGQSRSFGGVWEADPESWWHEVEINVRGPFNCARAVLPGMLERRRGRIVVLASVAGLWTAPGGTAYCSSKAAVIRFVDCLAAEVNEHGISVFAVQPGWLKTPMNERAVALCEEYLAEGSRRSPSVAVRRFLDGALRAWADGNFTPVERPVGLVLYLASGRADALSGCFLDVADDITDLVRRAEEIQRDDLYKMRLRK